MALRLASISFDCDDVVKVASFWSAVLGRPLDEGSSHMFASIGGADGARAKPAWSFNKVPEPTRAKNRVHADLTSPDPSTVGELVALSAGVGEHVLRGAGHSWTVMRDPEGNEFCVAAKSFTGWA